MTPSTDTRVSAWRLLGCAVALLIVGLGADYAYFRGFDDGADTSTCVFALQLESNAEAMQEHSCRNIKGRKPLPRIFPGTNGDEPTVWNNRAALTKARAAS